MAEKRAVVAQATKRGLSERHACRLVKVTRSSVRYQAHPRQSQPWSDQEVQERLEQIKAKHPRFGSPRAHALLYAELRSEGKSINHKRVERLWRKGGLQVPQRPKKRKLKTGLRVSPQAEHPNHVWSYDFQADALVSGRKLRLLNILDEFTREWLSVTVSVSLTSQAVLAALMPLFLSRGIPRFLRSDNGPEFIAAEVQDWLKQKGTAPHFIDPGCPWQNGFVESCHGKLRDELLDREIFVSVAEAQTRLETHRRWYNEGRPHSSLNYLPPVTFARNWREEKQNVEQRPKQNLEQQRQEAIEPPV